MVKHFKGEFKYYIIVLGWVGETLDGVQIGEVVVKNLKSAKLKLGKVLNWGGGGGGIWQNGHFQEKAIMAIMAWP